MEIYTRPAADADKERFIWIEKGATPGLAYVGDVWELFTKSNEGEFSAAFYNNELGGIGKLTRLYKSYAWLECLRVHPNYQGKGLGKAIYERYMEQMEEMSLTAAGMYTNYDNIVSRSLAEKFGLTVRARFSEYTKSGFKLPEKAISPLKTSAGFSLEQTDLAPFIVLNRTFYPVKEGLAKILAQNNWLYIFDCGIIIMGCRFQPKKALHIAHMEGDKDKLLDFSYLKAAEIGANTITAMRPYDNEEENEFLQSRGFVKNNTDYITLWKGLSQYVF